MFVLILIDRITRPILCLNFKTLELERTTRNPLLLSRYEQVQLLASLFQLPLRIMWFEPDEAPVLHRTFPF